MIANGRGVEVSRAMPRAHWLSGQYRRYINIVGVEHHSVS
jgi:hypothetical protein